MYEDAEATLVRILSLVDKCPDSLKQSCFDILLKGYVEAAQRRTVSATPPEHRETGTRQKKPAQPDQGSLIPPELLSRFQTTAKRLGVNVESIEQLFDFSSDPVSLHAVDVPGETKAEKTRNVALLVAAKSYLITGAWAADWKEIKTRAVDQNCYDVSNHSQFLKAGRPNLFKTVDVGKSVELSSNGIKEAEKLLKMLTGGD